jgi:alkanesulfonate monooxygenase SsuD/methylene tetrahydromethanopterin reductase-like flavin-dependent oxidoreductase (luciferase family)
LTFVDAPQTTVAGEPRIGVLVWLERSSWPDLARAIAAADEAGLDSLWCSDHLLAPTGDLHDPTFEAWSSLAAAAALTSHMSVGTLVNALGFRNVGLLAKLASTLDHISGGRAVLGLGAGWLEAEYVAHGMAFGPVGARIDALGEAIPLIRALHAGETVTYESERYRLSGARHRPRPVRGRVPILIGGEGRHKTLRLVAEHADMWNARGSADRLRQLDLVLREHCEATGRDPAEIERLTNRWIVVRDDVELATRELERSLARHGVASYDPAIVALGPPESVAEQLRDTVAAGFGHIVCSVRDPRDLETITRLREVRERLGSMVAGATTRTGSGS